MIQKILISLSMLLIVPLIAGVYGILHDQITYSISSEYFTHFKFIQFNIADYWRSPERFGVALVGFMATWWVGIPIALLLVGFGIKSLDRKKFSQLKFKAIKITFGISMLLSLMGYFVGIALFSGETPMNFHPSGQNRELAQAINNITDWESFMIVGSIHNFSYIGGILGTITAMIYQYRWLRKNR